MKRTIKNSKGFTLIELIIVTIILGVLAAVAIPRYMGSVSNAEAAAEAGTIAAMRTAVENYARQKFLDEGRWSYPPNPFNYIEVSGYNPDATSLENLGKSEWMILWNGNHGNIYHKRRDDNVYQWTYRAYDMTDLDGDDRGSNVGLAPENPGQGHGNEAVLNGKRHVGLSGDSSNQQDGF